MTDILPLNILGHILLFLHLFLLLGTENDNRMGIKCYIKGKNVSIHESYCSNDVNKMVPV